MTTLVISGTERAVVSGADLYDARTHRVVVDQWDGPKSAANVTASPRGALWLGGQSIGSHRNRTEARQTLYKRGPGSGNGAGVRFENSPEITCRRHYSEYAWDPIKFASGSMGGIVEECLLTHARDDCIEADPDEGPGLKFTVRRSALLDFHTMCSVTPGGGNSLSHPVTIEFLDSIMSSGNILANGLSAWRDRDDRDYAWGDADSGSQVFKLRGVAGMSDVGGGSGITCRFINNAIMMRHNPRTSRSNLRLFQSMTITPDSRGNRFYYLGDGKGLNLITFKGGLVPEEFELHRYPDVWDFVSNDPAQWAEAEHQRWLNEVWFGEEPDGNGNGEPPPADCVAELARIAELEAALARCDADNAALRAALASIRGKANEALG